MSNGTINRSQTIKTLAHGLHNVTRGTIEIGYSGDATVTKTIGIGVNDFFTIQENVQYSPDNGLFKLNLTSVLYEIRSAGQSTVS